MVFVMPDIVDMGIGRPHLMRETRSPLAKVAVKSNQPISRRIEWGTSQSPRQTLEDLAKGAGPPAQEGAAANQNNQLHEQPGAATEQSAKRDLDTSLILKEAFDKNISVIDNPDFGEVSAEQKKLYEQTHKLFRELHQNPSTIEDMPVLPFDENKVTGSEYESRKDLEVFGYVPETMSADQVASAENWLTRQGFDPALINENIAVRDIPQILTLKGNFAETMDKYTHDNEGYATVGLVSVRKLLEMTRVATGGEVYVQNLQHEAQDGISKFAPEFALQNPISVVYRPNLDARGIYAGMHEGRHIIGVSSALRDNPYASFSDFTSEDAIMDMSVMQHEMIHARHSELVGESQYFQFKENERLPDLRGEDDDVIFEALRMRMDDRPADEGHRDMHILISEGAAIRVQLTLLDREIRSEEDSAKKDALKKTRLTIHRMLSGRNEYDRPYTPSEREKMSKYRDGVRFVTPLYRAEGIQKLPEILKQIDYDACAEIDPESDLFKQIQQDPRRIPGLANYLEVNESVEKSIAT